MTPSLDTPNRRTLLGILGAAGGTGALERTFRATAAEPERSVVLEQDDRCVELTPLSGEASVEEFYDYRYPTSSYEGVSGSEGYSYSSAGTTDLQRDRTSILFLYDGPDGLSLVVVHGHLEGDDDGGVVTFTLRGMPEAASWVVRDDYYLEDGQPAESNFDRWDGEGDVHELDWAYKGGRTDGGAVRGLGAEFEISVEPAFNDDANLAADHDFGSIEAWEALSGDRDSPERFPLRLDRPVTVRTGGCEQGTAGAEQGDRTTDEEATDETVDDETTDDSDASDEGRVDDRRETKHERKRRKREEKYRKRQRKHEEKHERKRRKHEEKGDRGDRKHRRKQRKHDRRGRKHGEDD